MFFYALLTIKSQEFNSYRCECHYMYCMFIVYTIYLLLRLNGTRICTPASQPFIYNNNNNNNNT